MHRHRAFLEVWAAHRRAVDRERAKNLERAVEALRFLEGALRAQLGRTRYDPYGRAGSKGWPRRETARCHMNDT